MLHCIGRIFNILSFYFNKNLPESSGSAPNIARATSVLPAPINPAKPTISPLYSSKLTSFIVFPLFKFLLQTPFLSISLSFLVLIVINFPSNHHRDNLFNRCILCMHRSYICTVSHNRYTVRNFL